MALANEHAWYCIYTHAKCEHIADCNLADQGFETFFPQFHDDKKRLVPLFPRYSFVAFNQHSDPWRRIVSTRGVKHILSSTPESPTPIQHHIMIAFRLFVDEMFDTETPETPILLPNTPVRFKRGQFVNLYGITKWVAKKRVAVLMQMMGRELVTICSVRDVELVECVP